MKQGTGQVCLYTHWAGTALPQTLRAALIRGKGRWDDDPYLTRIIFCEMIQHCVLDDTGYGISPEIGDGDNQVLRVDVANQTVQVGQAPLVSFADYVAAPVQGWGDPYTHYDDDNASGDYCARCGEKLALNEVDENMCLACRFAAEKDRDS